MIKCGTIIRTDQWNKIKRPEINPNTYSQLLFNRVPRQVNEEGTVSFANDAGTTRTTCGRMKLDLVMINFVCLPDIWSDTCLDVAVRHFKDEINI